ncbi:MAG: PspA/IM30 family protein [Micromonosporaceae bacterium]|nr:PspA/IM30 family protein [Micromonosporaceae bacterium]
MANPFVKGWRYLMALFGAKIDEYADPKVQIQQAIDEAKVQHQTLVKQAAAVIGNQRQLEMRLSRHMTEVEKWQGMARQGLVLADRERAEGDEQKAQEYEKAAQSAATQLVTSEQAVEDLKSLHDQALSAAQQARKAVENNKMLLEEKLAERTKLLSQLEQARMQETVASSLESMSALAAPGNTPSLDEVRDKIEQRYATAMGRAELASDTVEGRMIEVQRTTLDMAGQSRLGQIRASMFGEQLTAGAERPAVESGEPADQEQAGSGDATVSRLDEIRASLAKEGGKNPGKNSASKNSAGKNSGDAAAAT